MEISFFNRELRTICEDDDQATTSYGVEVARNLQRRIADILAVKSVKALGQLPGKLTRTAIAPFSDWRLEMGGGYWIFFNSAHPKCPESDGDFDEERITRIKLIKIDIIHGQPQ